MVPPKKLSDLTSDERLKITEYKDRFNKWHMKQIDLLSFLINLFITLSIAIAGFIISNEEKAFFKDKTLWSSYSLTRTILLALAASVTLGVLALISRLEDFRRTKNILEVRRRIYESQKGLCSENSNDRRELGSLRSQTTCMGRATWCFFYAQLFLFMITLWSLICAI